MTGAVPGSDVTHHTLVVLVENKAGVLARIAGLFARRGYNIYSLAVAPTDDERFSRITIVVDIQSSPLEQITKQLFKLIHVVKISELAPAESVERELLMVTVAAAPDVRGQVIELVQVYDGRIVAVSSEALTVCLDGHPDTLDDFEELLRGYGIVELQRSGRIALPKLPRGARPPTRVRRIGRAS
jgi:acetolactate synthase-1/3 small subunit